MESRLDLLVLMERAKGRMDARMRPTHLTFAYVYYGGIVGERERNMQSGTALARGGRTDKR